MEELKHKNDIEIKLLPNRRFLYANRRQNIVITTEHLATEITVLYPEEYEHYSKRVDFVNSKGKEWTEGLYTPEYHKKHYPHGFDKCRFHFALPSEVTTEGELKMQFIAYKPDKSMVTVPFEIIPIDVLDGVLAFKKNARSNPDLLILSYNQSTEALFNSQRAVAKSEKAERTSEKAEQISGKADEQSQAAVETANAAKAESGEALTVSNAAKQAADTAEQNAAQAAETANGANAKSDTALGMAGQAKSTAKQAKLIAVTAREFAQGVVDRANNGEFKGDKGDTGDKGQDGYVFAVDSLMGFYVDEDGNFYAYAGDTANISFRYDEESGNFYLVSL